MMAFRTLLPETAQPAQVWKQKYWRKKEDAFHCPEDNRLGDSASTQVRVRAIAKELMKYNRLYLDPPDEIRYSKLLSFLQQAKPIVSGGDSSSTRAHSTNATELTEKTILIDDRKDPNSMPGATRDWDEDGDNGYFRRPPKGIEESIYFKQLSTSEFIQRVTSTTRREMQAEKRIVQATMTDTAMTMATNLKCRYVPNLTPETALALVTTVAIRNASTMRGFLNRHLQQREYFSAGDFLFELEMHIPFFALRKGKQKLDRRNIRGTRLRGAFQLPLNEDGELISPATKEWYHEAVFSLSIIGIDEWVWTAYCCVDTSFGEEKWSQYLTISAEGQDGPSGRRQRFPFWNPREYFLAVLRRRMNQATAEWSSLVYAYVDRLNIYENAIRHKCFDEADLRHTEELKPIVNTLHLFKDRLSLLIHAWEGFERRHLRVLEPDGKENLRNLWQSYIDAVQTQVFELQYLRELLTHKLAFFDSTRKGFSSASALRESTNSTRQGTDIGLLTKMTVCFLPLSFVASIFSMGFLPNRPWMVGVFLIALILTTSATIYIARHGEFLNLLFRQ